MCIRLRQKRRRAGSGEARRPLGTENVLKRCWGQSAQERFEDREVSSTQIFIVPLLNYIEVNYPLRIENCVSSFQPPCPRRVLQVKLRCCNSPPVTHGPFSSAKIMFPFMIASCTLDRYCTGRYYAVRSEISGTEGISP